jgi:hypothetical protein
MGRVGAWGGDLAEQNASGSLCTGAGPTRWGGAMCEAGRAAVTVPRDDGAHTTDSCRPEYNLGPFAAILF